MLDLAAVSSFVIPLATGLGGWFAGRRKRRVDTETSAFDLYERALRAQGRTEEMLQQAQRASALTQRRLDQCERARVDLTAEMDRLRDEVSRLAQQQQGATS